MYKRGGKVMSEKHIQTVFIGTYRRRPKVLFALSSKKIFQIIQNVYDWKFNFHKQKISYFVLTSWIQQKEKFKYFNFFKLQSPKNAEKWSNLIQTKYQHYSIISFN